MVKAAELRDLDRQAGRLTDNIAHFARALRRGGLPVGPARVVEATRAVEAAGFSSRADFYWTLHACFVSRPEHRALFDAAFHLFWRDPEFSDRMLSMMLQQIKAPREERKPKAAETRAKEALLGGEPPPPRQHSEEEEEIEFDASFSASDQEKLRARDFEQMTNAEIQQAQKALAQLRIPAPSLRSRRLKRSSRGAQPDWRAASRASFRTGGQIFNLPRRAPRRRAPSLVALADISGSMSAYSRMLLHFLHGLSLRAGQHREEGWARVESFVFGTRLTRITRHLRRRDVDEALSAAGLDAQDWEGGTRIGECLEQFNKIWARRLLGQGAVVLLITDGLERDDAALLAQEADRLRRSCRKLIWLNPLLRWDGFEAKARGVAALLPQVDSFRAAHNIESLAALADALSRPEDPGEKTRLLEKAHDPG